VKELKQMRKNDIDLDSGDVAGARAGGDLAQLVGGQHG